MERLTAKDWKNSPHLQIEPTTQEEYDSQRLYTRLAELEDKLESGQLVELPCLRDKPTIYYHNQPILRKELNYMTKDGTICSESFSQDEFEEAEAKLKELTEKK